jgi:glycosyltransferase involved in cell wall biosynthesis
LPDLGPLLTGIDLPVVFVSHGAGDWTARAVQSSESACSHFVAVSETALLPFRPHTRARAIVLHNGVDVERCAPTQPREITRHNLGFDDQDILIGYVGRFSFEKNPLAAVIAARKLGGRFHAVYCGEGWKEAEVRSAAEKIAGDRVRFVPHQRVVGNILSALDVFLLASPAEGFSLSLTEAWYAGVPTVATRVGAVPELERNNGELVSAVPVNPSPRILARAVLRAHSPTFRQEIVPRAQKLVAERYTSTAMARRWTDYLETICGDQP